MKISRRRLLVSSSCAISLQLGGFKISKADILLISPAWVEVAEWAITQLLRGVGATLFREIFAEGDKVKWSQLINDTVKETSSVVQQELTENEIRRLTGNLEHVERLMDLYNVNKSAELLNYATRDISQALSQLKSFGMVAYGGFILASFEYIAILQERAKRFSWTEGNTLNMAIDEITSHIHQLHVEWEKWHQARFSQLTHQTIKGYFQHKYKVSYKFTDQGKSKTIEMTSDWLNGTPCDGCWTEGTKSMKQKRDQHIKSEQQKLQTQHLMLGNKLIKQLEQLRK